MSMFHLSAIFCFFVAIAASWTSNKIKCPAITPLYSFNRSRFLGLWYPVRNYPTGIENYVCRSSYFADNDVNGMSLEDFGIDAKNGQEMTQQLNFKLYDPSKPSIFKVIYDSSRHADFYILGTDYDSFAVVRRCFLDHKGTYSLSGVVIYTRQREVSDSDIKMAFKVTAEYRIHRKLFMELNQANCPP